MSVEDLKRIVGNLFAFRIGDHVVMRSSIEAIEASRKLSESPDWIHAMPVIGVVEERVIQECHGGVQTFYRVRWGKIDFDGERISHVLHQHPDMDLMYHHKWLEEEVVRMKEWRKVGVENRKAKSERDREEDSK